MPADLHLDPDGLRRAAATARRIADGLDAALESGAQPVGGRPAEVGRTVRRARNELLGLAEAADGALARAEAADREAARALARSTPAGPPVALPRAGDDSPPLRGAGDALADRAGGDALPDRAAGDAAQARPGVRGDAAPPPADRGGPPGALPWLR